MRYTVFGGRTGLKVSTLALGTGLFGTAYGYGSEPDEIDRMFNAYADAGGNFIDVSDAYQLGGSETAVGKFIAPRRDAFVVASKYSRGFAFEPAVATVGNSRKVMVQSVEASLKRLNTDRIDLYLAHLDDGITPVEEIARGFDDLVRAGKVVYAGLSNFPAWRIAAAAMLADLRGWAPIAAIQVQYSLVARATEQELLPMAAAMGLGVMGYSPLAAGLLTGKYRHGTEGRASTALKGSVPAMDARNEAILDRLAAVANSLSCSLGAVALAWAERKGVIPVIGPRTHTQLLDNLTALDVVLSDDVMRQLDEASALAPTYPHDILAPQRQQMGLVAAQSGRVA